MPLGSVWGAFREGVGAFRRGVGVPLGSPLKRRRM